MLKTVAATIAIFFVAGTGVAKAEESAVGVKTEESKSMGILKVTKEDAEKAPADEITSTKKVGNKLEETDTNLKEWGFGLGIGIEQYRNKYIDQAGTYGTNRLVLIEKDYKTLPSAWLTLNWNISGNETKKVRYGFFTGVKLLDSNSQVFSAFSLGPQITFKAQERKVSVGFGWVTHRTKTLANGISEGSALPAHFTDIKYKEGSENSYMMMFSVGL